LATAEMARYAEEVCTPDTAGLLAADSELAQRHQAMQSSQLSVDQATRYMTGVSGGIPSTAADYGIPPGQASIMVVISNIDESRFCLARDISPEHLLQLLRSNWHRLRRPHYEPSSITSRRCARRSSRMR